MHINKVLLNLLYFTFINELLAENAKPQISDEISDEISDINNPANVFNGVYTECFFHLSYTCLQKKTLLYLKELNKLNEISVIGDYVKFVKLNNTDKLNDGDDFDSGQNSDELAYMIDKAVDKFFDNHLIRFSALGKDVLVPNKANEFVGRKKRKGGGGGGHGGDDGGKKKMMMMAMMCMKMKLMMMVPAMMGMMGMMSFKGMMFSMMSFMISKMMLLMKILEKKGGGAGGGGGDGGWAAGGGSGGAWMPTGQDYGGGGGYDANGQWQSRSIIDVTKYNNNEEKPNIVYAQPIIKYTNKLNRRKSLNSESFNTNVNNEMMVIKQENKPKSRKKRGILDALQTAYMYWTNKVLGIGNKRYNYPKYKVFNGVKYVYQPVRNIKAKSPKELQSTAKDEIKVVDNFNKGEIVEDPIEGRMIRKKFHKMKENVKETVDDNPWE